MRWFCLFLFALVSTLHADDRPNIIMIMPDDMGYGDLGATGNEVIRTPHLDRLASEAATLSDFYVSPVCSPTRACLMTGRYNHRTRCIDTFKGRSMMDPDEVTLAEALQAAGYATGIFGKWHLGDNHPMRPQDQGFDEVLIHRGGGLAQPSEPIANERRYTDPILFRNGEAVRREGYCTDIYFDDAIAFMEKSAASGQPFFAYIPPNAPHGPYHDVPEELLEYYQSIDLEPILNGGNNDRHKDTVARVFAMIENIDENVGKLDAFLESSGLKENTIVLFFTDNGPNSRRYVGPFRGSKSNVHEGGIRTCFYARWPKRFEAGHSSDRIAAHIDMMPTLLAAAGAEPPSNVKFDGINVLPLLEGEPESWQDRAIIIQTHRGNEPVPEHHIAVRTEDWKLVRDSGFGNESLPENAPEFELYAIREDPGEENDLSETKPEKVEELRSIYADWLADVSTTRPDNFAPPRISLGADSEPVVDLSLQDWRVAPDSPGWGEDGKWFVDVLTVHRALLEVRFAEAPGEREITVTMGDQVASGTLTKGSSTLDLGIYTLPKGPMTVSIESSPTFVRDTFPRFVTFSREE
ncbi:MAG: arylsulfatase [Verrucomicrobiota bacterium]